jgi:4'-phosphopantetheinyl transferase
MLRVYPWSSAARVGVPRPGDVDVWIVALAGVSGAEAGEIALDEMERANRLRFDVDRQRFLGTRLTLRRILGRCLGLAAREVRFRAGPFGKPFLDPGRHGTFVRFNVSHSGEMALIAVAGDVEVGVDVELRHPMPDVAAIAARYFSPRERAALAALPAARQLEAFFDYWTLKEAYLKACGDGLNRRLDAFDVALEGDASTATLLEARDRRGDERRWRLARLDTVTGYAAAVVTAVPPVATLTDPRDREDRFREGA